MITQEKSGQRFTFSVNTKKSLRRKEREDYNLLYVLIIITVWFCICAVYFISCTENGVQPTLFAKTGAGAELPRTEICTL